VSKNNVATHTPPAFLNDTVIAASGAIFFLQCSLVSWTEKKRGGRYYLEPTSSGVVGGGARPSSSYGRGGMPACGSGIQLLEYALRLPTHYAQQH